MRRPKKEKDQQEVSQEISGPEVVKLIEKLSENERAAKASAQTRGLAVITTSGTLVTLLLAFAALATRKQATFVLPTSLKIPLILASVLLVVAAIGGLIVNMPGPGKTVELDVTNLANALTRDRWNSSNDVVTRGIALDQVDVLIDARRLNSVRARILACAITAEIMGISCTTWGVIALVATY